MNTNRSPESALFPGFGLSVAGQSRIVCKRIIWSEPAEQHREGVDWCQKAVLYVNAPSR